MITVGDRVVCRLYNTPERKFYGKSWNGEVVSIDKSSEKPFVVTRPSTYSNIALHRNEIRRISNGIV